MGNMDRDNDIAVIEQAQTLAKHIPLEQLQSWLQAKQYELDVIKVGVALRYLKDRDEEQEEQAEKTGGNKWNRHGIQEQAETLAQYITLDQLQTWLHTKQYELDVLSAAVVIRYKKEREKEATEK